MKKNIHLILFLLLELCGVFFLIGGSFFWPLIALGCFIGLITLVIGGVARNKVLQGVMVAFFGSLLVGIIGGTGILATFVRHASLVLLVIMLWYYDQDSVSASPFHLTVRAASSLSLFFALASYAFFSLHFTLKDIDCSDINSLAQSNNTIISGLFDDSGNVLPTIKLKESAPERQTTFVDYLTQLENTREQKQLLDGEICSLFLDTVRSVSTQRGVQLGSGILLFLLAYSIMYLPLLIICYLLAFVISLSLRFGRLRIQEKRAIQKYIR